MKNNTSYTCVQFKQIDRKKYLMMIYNVVQWKYNALVADCCVIVAGL